MMACSQGAALEERQRMIPVSYGASGRAWSDALMIIGRLFTDPAIGGRVGNDSVRVQKRETG
jgi:hypothetical protein